MVNIAIACNIMAAIANSRTKDAFCDFTIIIGDKRFSCHRFILNACSGFFSDLLQSERKTTSFNAVTIDGIPSQIFSLILGCFYSGESILTEENVIDVWHAAHLLKINFLLIECEKFLIEILAQSNCMDIYRHAKILRSGSVLEATQKIMLKDFDSVSSSPSFSHLYPEDLQAMIESDGLNVASEDAVVDAILMWVSCSPSHKTVEPDTKKEWFENIDCNLVVKTEMLADNLSKNEREGPDSADHHEKDDSQKTVHLAMSKPNSKGLSGNQLSSSDHVFEQEVKSTNVNADDSSYDNDLSGPASGKSLPSKTMNKTDTNPCETHFSELLKACRLCLASPYCIESLLNNELVMSSKEALIAVREAVIYQLKPGSYWPPSALHRTCSAMENVAVFVSDKKIKVYSMRGNRIYVVCSLPDAVAKVTALQVANDQIFMICEKQGDFYTASSLSLNVQISPVSLMQIVKELEGPKFLLPLAEFMYIGKGRKLFRFNVRKMYGDKTCVSLVCTLPVNLHEFKTVSTATVGRKLLLFCSDNVSISVRVFSIDTLTFKIDELDSLDGPAEKMVAFGDGKNSYILQENGTLQLVVDSPGKGVGFNFLTKLWGFDWSLLGAVVYGKVLFLFGGSASEQRSWSSSLPGYFDHIRVIHVKSSSPCLPIAIRKKWMFKNA